MAGKGAEPAENAGIETAAYRDPAVESFDGLPALLLPATYAHGNDEWGRWDMKKVMAGVCFLLVTAGLLVCVHRYRTRPLYTETVLL